jgi:hypothetical protein
VPEINYENMLFGHAMRAAAEGMSANAFLRAAAEAGAGVRRAVGLHVYAEAKRLVAEYGEAPFRNPDVPPSGSELQPWPTRGAEGVLQTVHLFYRERVTGKIKEVVRNVKSPAGLPPRQVVSQVAEAESGRAEEYQQDLIGAVHTGAALLVPSLGA